MREEVLQRFDDPSGDVVAAVTQNAYGSLVLSTARIMFIDLDFPETASGQQVRHFFAKLFNKTTPSPESLHESTAMSRLEQFVCDHGEWGARIYRTCAGLRVLVTHGLFEPAAAATQSLFAAMGADPMYARLCKEQDSFRARLTPKPWRCGHTANTIRWPRETDAEQRQFAAWNAAYVERQANFATCRFVRSFGNAGMHPDVATVLDVHDRTTRCHESLPLA